MSDRTRILIADDEQNLCRVLAARLRKDGHDADTVHDGAEALARLAAAIYHLVMLDLRMPILGGMDVLAEIRRCYPATAVIVMTAYDSEEAVHAVMAAGAHSYVTKPFDLDRVAAEVSEVLQRSRVSGSPGG
ncbi:MAG: response regulator [Armatimonadetes bacterium]|nr:response regulator [Armatimonadota bacterium]